MPAADNTQAQTNPAQQASTGTTMPDDPTALLFQAPDYSKVPVRRHQPAKQDDRDNDDRDRGRNKNQRNSKRNGQRHDSNGKSSRNAKSGDEQQDAEKDSSRGKREEDQHHNAEKATVSHRRRRRRRGNVDLEMDGGGDGDPEQTVTRVRAPRQASTSGPDEVTSLRGSTRLEAKRQRRRTSRRGRRKNTVVSEAEFLARRESVERKMMVRQHDNRIQIAVLEDGVLAEHFVSNTQQDSLIGNVYLGKVQNVLPSMEAAFVDIGRGRNAVLYAGEVNWDTAQLDGKPKKIENALKSGDSVLVQVTKDPVGHKGARLTAQVSLPGRYLVYVPGGTMTGISRKLPDVERNRLKTILKEHLPDKTGVIVRTAAEGIAEDELLHDINRLRTQWEEIEAQSKSNKVLAPELLHSEPDLTIKVVRDVFNEDFTKMLVDGEDVWDKIEAYVTYVAPDLVDRLEKWDPAAYNGKDLFDHYRLDEQLHKALERKVNLPSGGSLIFDRTEAMTVVDVNTGKFTGSGGNLEETVTKNNLEAAEELVRQLRLRDIGGIIVVDFIDMVLESNRDLVVRRMVECLGRDRSRHQVAEVTSLGLVQMTRKRMGTGLVEVFSHTCEHCAGRGIIVEDEPIERGKPYETAAQRRRGGEAGTRRNRRRNKDQSSQQTEHSEAAQDEHHDEKAEQTRHAIASIAAATNGNDTESKDEQHGQSGAGSSQRRRRGDRRRKRRGGSSQQRDNAKDQQAKDSGGVSTGEDSHQQDRRATAQQQDRQQQKQSDKETTAESTTVHKPRRRAASSATGATDIRQATQQVQQQGKTFAASASDQPKKQDKPVKSAAILGVGVAAEDISSPRAPR
ncbi:MAG TPA: Rne/Rng family ribonuclease [Candidatus Yaniella excrementigallinarum]|nr:Rne/Rng family ribonuclease [Candidatus Yaniella excrementigallinarum]